MWVADNSTAKNMKLDFDGHQDYQLQAIQAVIDIFEGQPLAKSAFEVSLQSEVSSLGFTDKGIANQLILKSCQGSVVFRNGLENEKRELPPECLGGLKQLLFPLPGLTYAP